MKVWLDYLQKNHPDYKNITIDNNNSSVLPEDGSIHYSPPTRSTLPEAETLIVERNLTQDRSQAFDSFKAPDTVSVVPNLHLAETELSQLQQDLDRFSIQNFLLSNQQEPNFEQRLSLPTFRQTPFLEFDGTCILKMIFPTLFPTGERDKNFPREQKISFDAWIWHLLHYKDGRFASHSRFRYVVFNMPMRQKARTQSLYLFSKHLNKDMS